MVQVFRRGDALVNRFQLVHEHARRHGVKRLCHILGLEHSSYYHWLVTKPERAAREAADQALAEKIRTVHRESQGTYGTLRVTAELREAGEQVNRKRVVRVMRKFGIAGVRLRRRHTTVADQAAVKAPDLLRRDYTVVAARTPFTLSPPSEAVSDAASPVYSAATDEASDTSAPVSTTAAVASVAAAAPSSAATAHESVCFGDDGYQEFGLDDTGDGDRDHRHDHDDGSSGIAPGPR
jgi:hypothetical protein